MDEGSRRHNPKDNGDPLQHGPFFFFLIWAAYLFIWLCQVLAATCRIFQHLKLQHLNSYLSHVGSGSLTRFLFLDFCLLGVLFFFTDSISLLVIILFRFSIHASILIGCMFLGNVSISSRLWRSQWHPTPVLLPGKSHGWRSLVGCSPWVAKSWTWLNDFTFTFPFMHWRWKWQPTPVFLSGESQGWGSLVGCCLWGLEESDTTEAT